MVLAWKTVSLPALVHRDYETQCENILHAIPTSSHAAEATKGSGAAALPDAFEASYYDFVPFETPITILTGGLALEFSGPQS